MTATLAPPPAPGLAAPRRIEHFEAPSLDATPAEQLRRIREQAPAFREWLRRSGTVTAFAARSLVTLPYPRRFGLWEACSLPLPYVWMTNRMFVVQWRDDTGRTRTLLAEPSDYDLGTGTPYIARALRRMPGGEEKALRRFFVRHPRVLEHLAAMGIAAADVDYVSFDHLHTQDIRRITGTNGPAPDLGHPDTAVPPMFPNARVIVQREELEHVRDVHPFQQRFHQSRTYADIREDTLLVVAGDVLVGPGVALLRTPGHTLGNHTLAVSTERGIFTSSENGIAVECYAPEHSNIPGVRSWARAWGLEVVMNFNTPEYASWQYNSMVKEKLIADPLPGRPELPQVFPSSELTRHRYAPGIRPIHEHGDLTVGTPAGGAAREALP
jgi:glyoxylase-like metal-dependent hydrolase (beta-lactamase superfamily II)